MASDDNIVGKSARTFETVAFGLNEESKFKRRPFAIPTARALRPRDFGQGLELSMFSIDCLAENDIWLMLNHALRMEKVPARADYISRSILDCGLRIDPNWSPERHVNIIGWPEDPGRREQIVQELVKLATVLGLKFQR